MDVKIVASDRDGTGIIYVVTGDGSLLFYQDLNRNGTQNWGGGTQISTGWQQFSHVFAGGSGILYAVNQLGQLLWYQDLARNGTSNWHPNSGQVIATGWNGYPKIFYGGDSTKPGIIYAIGVDGRLRYFRDTARNGTPGWEYNGQPQFIGSGWGGFLRVFAGDAGAIYTVTASGALMFYQDIARNGLSNWTNNGGGQQLGGGFAQYAEMFSCGGGTIYAITSGTLLMFYKDQAQNGTTNWAFSGLPQQIGSGWNVLNGPMGYCWPLSAAPGQSISFMVDSADPYTVTYRRLNTILTPPSDMSMGIVKGTPFSAGASPQGEPIGAAGWQNGYGWSTAFTIPIPPDWESGIYAAHLTNASHEYYVIFIVRPVASAAQTASRPNRIAVLANTLTWNGYNDNGGRSKYQGTTGFKLSFERTNTYTQPLRGTASTTFQEPNHLTGAELWVLNWLENTGYGVDVFTDQDFHAMSDSQIADLAKYGALLLNTHPEYWTRQMYTNLENYLKAGGNLLYLGGNGVFEHVEFDPTNLRAALYLENDPTNDGLFPGSRCKALLRNLVKKDAFWNDLTNPDGSKQYMTERALLGVAMRFDNAPWISGTDPGKPFQVLNADPRFFAGTGLAVGGIFGETGFNGPASGWEMDTSLKGSAPDGALVQVNVGHEADSMRGADNLVDDRGVPPAVPSFRLLARGTNTLYGADMTYYETGYGARQNPAFVFSAGAISVGGSLAVEPKLQQIIKNVLALAGLQQTPH